jgi:hypothetical protein
MYKSSNDSIRLYPYNPTVQFSHVGGANDSVEAVSIQFYEPSKNPNRVLFFGEDLEGLGVNEMDTWLDSEIQAGTGNNIMNNVLFANPESDISVQYEIMHRKRINENDPWNYFGGFSKFIETTELIITHNDAIVRGRNDLEKDPRKAFGSIRVTPSSFKKRIITEKRDNTVISLLSTVGSFLSIIFALYVILFGTKPSKPWGFIQKSTQQKKKLHDELLERFDVPDVISIPLVTPVRKRYGKIYNDNTSIKNGEHTDDSSDSRFRQQTRPPPRSRSELLCDEVLKLRQRVEQLEGRNQILELVLKEYYIDEEIFKELKLARDNETTENREYRERLFKHFNFYSPETLFEARDSRDAEYVGDDEYVGDTRVAALDRWSYLEKSPLPLRRLPS